MFECLLLECKVCIISEHVSLLTPVAYGFLNLLFPLEWQGVFIPVMPSAMIEVNSFVAGNCRSAKSHGTRR